MASVEKTVFISYRRNDRYEALAVYQYLTTQHYDVFLDYASIPSGDFEQIIVSNIKARAHFILILTPTALDRCNQPGDWLRREIETAIDEKRNIIPLFFDDFSFGAPNVAKRLTGKLALLRRYNGLDIPAGYFTEAMERLCEQYLNVELEAVIHPVPTELRKAVQDAQQAANQALEQKKENIDVLVKPAEPKTETVGEEPAVSHPTGSGVWRIGGKSLNARLLGIGALILLLLVLGTISINAMLQNGKQPETPTLTQTDRPTITPSITQEIPGAPVGSESVPTPTPSPTGTATVTPTPTLGVGSTLTSAQDGMTLLYVPEGDFLMGSADGTGQSDERPQHEIFLDAFWIDQTEITNAMYRKCEEAGECKAPAPRTSKTHANYYVSREFNDFPVINVSWGDANNYCTWAGRRLPTEAEWEKAASWDEKNQQKLLYPWGDSIDCSLANYGAGNRGCATDTTQAGVYPDGASPYGLLDMAGNVWEWVLDNYDPGYYQDPNVDKNPQRIVPSGRYYVARGGSWFDSAGEVRTANRLRMEQSSRENTLGFRCVLPVGAPLP